MGRKVAIVDSMSGSLSVQRRMRKLMFRLYGLEDSGILNLAAIQENAEDPASIEWRKYVFELFKDETHIPRKSVRSFVNK